MAMTANVSPSWTAHKNPTLNDGFSMQLNAYGPPSSPCVFWQFWLTVVNKNIASGMEIWPYYGAPGPWVGPQGCPQGFCTILPHQLPSNTIPAGYILGICIEFDANANIISVTYSVTDNANNTYTQSHLMSDVARGVPPSYNLDNLAFPINSFEVDIVGRPDGNFAEFVSGSGVIRYRVSQGQLTCTPGGGLPPNPCTPLYPRSGVVSETSNVSYRPVCPSSRVIVSGISMQETIQSFST